MTINQRDVNIMAVIVLLSYLALVLIACTDAVEVPKPQPQHECLKWGETQVGFRTVFIESEPGAEPIAVEEPIMQKVCVLEGTR